MKKNLEAYLYNLQIKFKHKIPLSSIYIIQFYKGHLPLGRKGKRVHSCKTMVNETLCQRTIILISDYKWHLLRILQFYQRWKNFHLPTRYREIVSKINLRPVWSGPGGGYSHTLPIRVCAAQRGRDFEAPDLERGIHFTGVF